MHPKNHTEFAIVPFDQDSWDQWQMRGRAADAAFVRHVGTALVTVVALGCLAVSFWTLT